LGEHEFFGLFFFFSVISSPDRTGAVRLLEAGCVIACATVLSWIVADNEKR
jgi:hypothetical protein